MSETRNIILFCNDCEETFALDIQVGPDFDNILSLTGWCPDCKDNEDDI